MLEPIAAPAPQPGVTTITLHTPDGAQLSTGAQRMLRMVEQMPVSNDEEYGLAGDELKAIKAKANALETQRISITKPMNDALRAVNALFKAPGELLAQAENVIKRKMIAYDTERERQAAEERRRAEEAAAAERRRLEEQARVAREAAEAEQRRLAAEAEAAARAGDEAAAAQARAQAETVQQNAALEAAAIENVAAVIVAPAVVDAKVKVVGVSTAKSWDFEVTDLLAMVRYVAANPQHINVLKADEVRLRALVKAMGENLPIDGVRVFEKRTMRAAA